MNKKILVLSISILIQIFSQNVLAANPHPTGNGGTKILSESNK